MYKALASLLAMLIVACLSVSAFASGSAETATANVSPARVASPTDGAEPTPEQMKQRENRTHLPGPPLSGPSASSVAAPTVPPTVPTIPPTAPSTVVPFPEDKGPCRLPNTH